MGCPGRSQVFKQALTEICEIGWMSATGTPFNFTFTIQPNLSFYSAALNPTNSADRALSWETDLIQRLTSGAYQKAL